MTRPIPRRQTAATARTLDSETELRIHRHVLRALRCRFGAELTLRTAVRDGARKMLAAGASFPAVRHAMVQCVLNHPSALPDKLSLMTGESYASAVLKRMLAWTDDVERTALRDANR